MGRFEMSAARSLWTCLLALMVGASIAGAAPSSARALAIENDFTGTGSLKLGMNFFMNNFIKCTSATIKGTVSKPIPDAKATISSWSPEGCAVYRNNKNVGSATVKVTTLPVVEAVSLTTLYLGNFSAEATFQINGSTCKPKFTVLADNPSYTNGSTTNKIDSLSIDEFTDWTSPLPEACEFAGGGEVSEVTFSFPNPQFEVTEKYPAYKLRNSNSAGPADYSFDITSEQPGDRPISGDWNKDGTDTIGFYRGGDFYLRNSNSNGSPDTTFSFANPGDLPVAGDWNNDGTDTIGVYRPSTGDFFLRDKNSGGPAEYVFSFANSGDLPVAGDWNGDGIDSIGVYRPSNGYFYLSNSNAAGPPDYAFLYGKTGDLPVAGDWANEGADRIGLFRPSNQTWYLERYNLSEGTPEWVFSYGSSTSGPIAGDWDKNGTDTPGTFQ